MPKFAIRFEREYTITEGFDRVIEAPSRAEAEAAANNLCVEFNQDCPDDCSEIGGVGAGDFGITEVTRKLGGRTDYRVLPDGQVVSS